MIVRQKITSLYQSRPIVASLVFAAALTAAVLSACSTPDPLLPPPPLSNLEAAAQRGHELVNGFGACGFCHSVDGRTASALSGGRLIRDMYGDVRGPNITLAKSGVGDWTELGFKNLLRANIRPDGSQLGSERHRGFEWLADSDISAITAYLRSIPSVENNVEPRRLSFTDRNITGFFETRVQVRGQIPPIAPSFQKEFGQYITDHVARCGSCHTRRGGVFSSDEYLAGGEEISFDGEYKIAPNITSSTSVGIGSWSEGAIRDFLRSGKTPEGREVDSRFCPVTFYARAPTGQVEAVVAYLRTVPAVD